MTTSCIIIPQQQNKYRYLYVLNPENLWGYYLEEGEAAPGIEGDIEKGEVIQDITTSFVALCAIYFPSVTGMLYTKYMFVVYII